MKRSFFLTLLMLLCGMVFSQSLRVAATADKQKILIGEPVQLYLKAVLKNNQPLPWFTVDTIPHFEILQKSKIDSQPTSEGLLLQQTLTLTSWDSGRWAVPPFVLANSKTKPLIIAVGYTPMDPNQPYHDIKDILEVQKPIASNWYWYLVGLAVLIALFLLFFPPKEEKTIAAAPMPAEDVYVTSMNRLKKLNVQDDSKYFYTELIDIFRFYLAQKKNIQSFSKTTDDLSGQLRQLSLPDQQYYELVQALQLSDMVKFAKYQPQVSDKEQALEVIANNIMALEKLT